MSRRPMRRSISQTPMRLSERTKQKNPSTPRPRRSAERARSFCLKLKGLWPRATRLFFEPITILPVDEAFPFDFWWQEGRLGLRWQVKDGYYLYRDRFLLTASDGESISLPLPEGRLERDPYFGDVYVLEAPIDLELALGKPIEQSYLQAQERLGPSGGFEVTYQGCAKQGYCYPPQKRLISVADRSR